MTPQPRPLDTSYETFVRGAVLHYPLVLAGRTIGHLWGSADSAEDAAGTVVVLSALDPGPRMDAVVFWDQRLRDTHQEGLSPSEALERWRGAPEDPVGGGIPEDAALQESPTKAELVAWSNPGCTPDPAEEGLPAPLPRHPDPEIVMRQVLRSYPRRTDGPVRYLPVRLGDRTVGYLWASVADDAASFLRDLAAQPESNFAETWWYERLAELHERGLGPLEAIRARVGAPEDPRGGRIDADAQERTAAGIAELEEIARS